MGDEHGGLAVLLDQFHELGTKRAAVISSNAENGSSHSRILASVRAKAPRDRNTLRMPPDSACG